MLYYKEINTLILESYNAKNKDDFIYKLKKKRLISLGLLLLFFTIIIVFTHDNQKQFIFKLLTYSLNFYSILIGFCITSVIYLAGDFNKFKDKIIDYQENEEKINTCKQISSTLLLTIYISFLIVVLGLINNYVFGNFDLIVLVKNRCILNVINFIYIYFVITLLTISISLAFKTLKYLKKYIDMVIESN